MQLYYLPKIFLLSIVLSLAHTLASQAQELTRIWGTVTEEVSGEPIPYVNISFKGTTIGTVSDENGKFYLESTEATSELKVSFIGYEPRFVPVQIGITQTIKTTLVEESVQLDNITITSKKLRYTNKNNPAVDMIKRILENKEKNKPTALEYFEYEKYEKVEFDLNNITDKFKNKRMMRKFQLIFDYVDTSNVNGKTYLPVFLRETISKVYYRQDPERLVEYKEAEKMTGFEDYFDNQGVSQLIDKMYQKVDIYDNSVNVLTQKFVSPISSIGPITYKYYIADTLYIDGEKLFKLAFQPRNENNLTFVGNLFITTDSTYAVRKASLKLSNNANINFVDDLFIEQEFKKNQFGTYDLVVDKIDIDFSLLTEDGLGMFGKRTVSYSDLKYNEPRDEEIYKGLNNMVENPDAENKPDEYWTEARHMELSRSEQGVFHMVEEVKALPAFQRMMDILTLLLVGYVDLGKFEIGPVGSFVSWNEIEGYRARFGGKTTRRASEDFLLAAYGAYGEKDEEWKYSATVTHFVKKSADHAIRLTYEKEIQNPGESLQFSNEDNLLLSFRRGANDMRFYEHFGELEYARGLGNGLSLTVGALAKNLQPAGILSFLPGENLRSTPYDYISKEEREQQQINIFESNLTLRFAPNEQFYQGEKNRTQIINKHPIFTLKYNRGIEGPINGEYNYDKLSFGVFKRTFVAPLGYFDTEIEARKLWGQVPYPLLNIPSANQTYSYQTRDYNLMSYMEFVSDQYVSLQYAHYFNGFFMNKIPLVKQLKLRSLITFKGLMGSLSELNDPSVPENDHLPNLPSRNYLTEPVGAMPDPATKPLDYYIETSFGISNIFKVFRVDLVRRWTQNGDPHVPVGYHVRFRAKIEF